MRDLERLLAEYYDDELSAGKRRRVEAHLRACSDDRAKLWQMERLSEILAQDALPENFAPAETFRSQVMLRLSRRQASQARYVSWVWYAVPVALLCVLITVQGVFALSGGLRWIADLVRWTGVSLEIDSWLLGAWDPSMISGNAVLSSVISLVEGSVRQWVFTVLLLIVFVPYVGWIGALWRAGTRPTSREER